MKIIKYYEYLVVCPDYRSIIYELCEDDFKRIRTLDKEEAKKLIERNHLKKVCGNKFGSIWA